eukprot:TRINITY_DN65484_c0_g1_i1.p1 TRINITY_DN65484_c0_g1~~TRINITY_DN65484_c0_g1_i1.p1  ORF type:complete len:447 (+),score=125.66 TRINITY_DN65484_c0_g1_i1:85-1425(+)
MAIDPFAAALEWALKRERALLDAVAEQHPLEWTAEKRDLMDLGLHDERVYALIAERGLCAHFVSLLSNPDRGARLAACRFLQDGAQYEAQWASLSRQKLVRLLRLAGAGPADRPLAHEAATLLGRLGRNENGHGDFLEYAYSWSDMMRTRDWPQERAAVAVLAWCFSSPHQMDAAAGVLSRTDILARVDQVYKKSRDYVARRLALTCLEVSGRMKLTYTCDEVVQLLDSLRTMTTAREAAVYFAAGSAWAFARHLVRWGVRGQLGAVATASVLAGCASASFGVYTGELLRWRCDCHKWAWLDGWGREQRLQKLRQQGRGMSPLPGHAAPPVGAAADPRFEGLEAVAGEVTELTTAAYKRACLALGLACLPLPWFLVVPRVLSTYQQLRLGPSFHRVFPALSLKYTRIPRAVIPFALLPTAAVKLASACPAAWCPEFPRDPLYYYRT